MGHPSIALLMGWGDLSSLHGGPNYRDSLFIIFAPLHVSLDLWLRRLIGSSQCLPQWGVLFPDHSLQPWRCKLVSITAYTLFLDHVSPQKTQISLWKHLHCLTTTSLSSFFPLETAWKNTSRTAGILRRARTLVNVKSKKISMEKGTWREHIQRPRAWGFFLFPPTNLQVQLLKHAKYDIVDSFNILPKTQHDFNSYVVDLSIQVVNRCFLPWADQEIQNR